VADTVEDLFDVRLDEFVAAREDLAKRLKAEGRTDEAADIGSPSRCAVGTPTRWKLRAGASGHNEHWAVGSPDDRLRRRALEQS
jgi:hypothetical protein